MRVRGSLTRGKEKRWSLEVPEQGEGGGAAAWWVGLWAELSEAGRKQGGGMGRGQTGSARGTAVKKSVRSITRANEALCQAMAWARFRCSLHDLSSGGGRACAHVRWP